MNSLEYKMVEILKDLKTNHCAVGVKVEFEAEGSKFEDALYLKKMADEIGLDLTIKIGGCEAIRDLCDAKIIGANSIVAPMIESPYAVQKYWQSIKTVFGEEESYATKFFINIETKYGFEYLEEIFHSDFFANLTGVILGRSDMAASLDMSKDDIDNEIMFKYANVLSQKAKKYKKEFGIGGGISAMSLPFIQRLQENSLNFYETRKIIFDTPSSLKKSDTDKGILKAIAFELMWLKYKQNFHNLTSNVDNNRASVLKARYKNSINEIFDFAEMKSL